MKMKIPLHDIGGAHLERVICTTVHQKFMADTLVRYLATYALRLKRSARFFYSSLGLCERLCHFQFSSSRLASSLSA